MEVCPNAWIVMENIVDKVRQDNWSKYFTRDMKTFLDRWHDTLGKGIERGRVERDWTIINKPYGIIGRLRKLLLVWGSHIPYARKVYRTLKTRLSRECAKNG